MKDALVHMKTPVSAVSAAVSMYYRGMSINNIKQELKQIYNLDVSDFAVYNWIERFTKDAIKITENYHPEAGYVWCADETVIDIAGKQYWLLDVIDVKTRFLLASKLSPNRWMEDIHEVLEEAYQRSGRIPKSIMTDHLEGYIRAIPSTFGAGTRHVRVEKFASKPNNNIIERMQGTIKARTKIMRDLKSVDTAKLILDGFFVHYNYMRPHETLSKDGNDITPAQKAGIAFPYGDWEQLIRSSQEAKRIPTARFDIPKLPAYSMTKADKKREYERVKSRLKRAKLSEGRPSVQQIGRPRKWK
jgi:transposase-like protein